jgi:Ca2+-binding EF-hand superfamily protein
MISPISSQDYYNQTQQTDPAAMLQQMVNKMFSKADSTGDGTISQDEFSQYLSANPRAERMLSRLATTTGTSSTSATDSSTSTGVAAPTTADDIFKAVDTNNDGSISKDELAAAMQKARPHGHHHHGGGGGGSEASQGTQGTQSQQANIIITLLNASSQTGATSTASTGTASTGAASTGTSLGQLLAEIQTQGATIDIYA